MDNRKIRCLLTVLEMGSINAAAERLHGTQSGITQTMNAIETELGFKILKRTNRGVALTEEGEKILPVFRTLDTDFAKLERQAEDIRTGKSSTIRIGTYSSIANAWLPDMISRYERTHADESFEITIGSDELTDLLESGKVDMLLADEAVSRGFDWYPILQDEYHAAIPVSFAISKKAVVTEQELMQYPMIIGTLNTHREFREIPEQMHGRIIRVGADDDTTIIRMVSKELGVSIMAGLSLRQLIPENVRIIPIDPPVYRGIGAVLPLRPSKTAKQFTRFLIMQEKEKKEKA